MDFTIKKYLALLHCLEKHNNHVIRHDVDVSPHQALLLAKVEAKVGVKAIYYFRYKHFKKRKHQHTIREIAALGHRIGYHYENLAQCHGDKEAAYGDFQAKLDLLRTLAPISTACAHGSPWSKWDSQEIWNQYDIHTLGIDYEPMLDTDFSHTLYLTDTGRRWDGAAVSIRDKVVGQSNHMQHEGLTFHSTDDIIHALSRIDHPIYTHPLLFNTHPERWAPFGTRWIYRLVSQWAKNAVKRIVVALRGGRR